MTLITGMPREKQEITFRWNFLRNKTAASSSLSGHVPILLHMLRHDKSAPIWLFSFVDLAFLLLIAFTQIGQDVDPARPDLGELEIPRIASSAPSLDSQGEAPGWQLRIHPSAAPSSAIEPRAPFELVEPRRSDAATDAAEPRHPIDATELAAHLDLLHDRQQTKPILAPHRDSRSEDLLVAVGLLEDIWRAGRSVAVVPAHRPVASARDARVREER